MVKAKSRVDTLDLFLCGPFWYALECGALNARQRSLRMCGHKSETKYLVVQGYILKV